MIMTLYDTGVRAAELCGMKVQDLIWRDQTILVAVKAGKQRRVSIGSKMAMSIGRYLRKRKITSEWLWLGSANKPLALDGLRPGLGPTPGAADREQHWHSTQRSIGRCWLLLGPSGRGTLRFRSRPLHPTG